MKITRKAINEALRFFASREFDDVPINDAEIAYTFSHEFEQKMEKLIKEVLKMSDTKR